MPLLVILAFFPLAEYSYGQLEIYQKQVKIMLDRFDIFINKYTNTQLSVLV